MHIEDIFLSVPVVVSESLTEYQMVNMSLVTRITSRAVEGLPTLGTAFYIGSEELVIALPYELLVKTIAIKHVKAGTTSLKDSISN
jgi:hypothetical protein